MERFFLNLKMERVWQRKYANQLEAIKDVTDYLVGFYNCVRRHSALGNIAPLAFEKQFVTKQPIAVSEIIWPPQLNNESTVASQAHSVAYYTAIKKIG